MHGVGGGLGLDCSAGCGDRVSTSWWEGRKET